MIVSPRVHTADHDPTVDHGHCETCNALLRRAFVKLADLDLGPKDVETLMARVREFAR